LEVRRENGRTPTKGFLGNILDGSLASKEVCVSRFDILYSNDISGSQSIATGRPPILRADAVDCQIPKDSGQTLESYGKATINSTCALADSVALQHSFAMLAWSFKHHFVKEVISSLSEKLSSAKSMKYSEVLEMDKRIRDFNAKCTSVDSTLAASLTSGPKFEQAGGVLRNVLGGIQRHFGTGFII